MNALELLKSARTLLTERARWTQSDFARDSIGDGTLPDSLDAVCWCTLGALHRINHTLPGDAVPEHKDAATRLAKAAHELYPDRIEDSFDPAVVAEFNDHEDTTHADILKVFDKAIEGAQ